MDTTPEYIKQCEKAEKIQMLWEPAVGDIFAHKHEDGGRPVEVNPIYLGHFADMVEEELLPLAIQSKQMRIKLYVWLPTQSQLQAMVGKSLWSTTLAFEFFLRGEDGHYNIKHYPFTFTSMEQLWLAFVMKEEYGKIWDGKNWVKEE